MNKDNSAPAITISDNTKHLYVDLFDTLLYRKKDPIHSFRKLARFLQNNYHLDVELTKLVASISTIFRTIDKHEAFNFRNLWSHYKLGQYIEFDAFHQDAVDLMLKAEIDETYINEGLVVYLVDFVNGGGSVHLISDFYLGKESISTLLRAKGINIFCDIFVSCDWSASKADGSLFSLVIPPENIRSSMFLDDNTQNIQAAVKFGLRCQQIDSTQHYSLYSQSMANYDRAIEEEALRSIWNPDPETFATNFIFYIFDYCRTLFSILDDGDTVYFLAREGNFLKKCFDTYSAQFPSKHISSEYLTVSRIALALLDQDISNMSPSEFAQVYRGSSSTTLHSIDELLYVLGLELAWPSCDAPKKHEDVFDTAEFASMFSSQDFKARLSARLLEAKTALFNRVAGRSARLILADVGWRGTMQDRMHKLLGPTIEITGYYLGLSFCSEETETSTKRGLLYDYNCYSVFSPPPQFSVLEPLLRSPEGQVVMLGLEHGDVILEDASIRIYQKYSAVRQEIMTDAFVNLCTLDASTPISGRCIKNLESKMVADYPSATVEYDMAFYRANVLGDDKDVDNIDYLSFVARKAAQNSIVRRGIRKIKRTISKMFGRN